MARKDYDPKNKTGFWKSTKAKLDANRINSDSSVVPNSVHSDNSIPNDILDESVLNEDWFAESDEREAKYQAKRGFDVDWSDYRDSASKNPDQSVEVQVPDDDSPFDAIGEWLAKQTGKFDASDIDGNLAYMAVRIVRHFDKPENQHEINDNDFMVNMVTAYKNWSRLTAGQAKGVLNWYRANIQYKARQDQRMNNQLEAEQTIRDHGKNIDLRNVPTGNYADPAIIHQIQGMDDDTKTTRLKVNINNLTPGMPWNCDKDGNPKSMGKWSGWIFVQDAAFYGSGQKYGAQRPDPIDGLSYYQGKIIDVLERIAADPITAMAAYGHLTNKCGKCGRPLEDAESVARGIGPICLGKM